MQDIRPMLIEAIRARPPLWSSSHIHYKLRKVQQQLWEEILQELPVKSNKNKPITVEYLKKQWKHLKDNYRKELKKPHQQWMLSGPMSFMEEEIKISRRAGSSSVWGGQEASSSDVRLNLSQDEEKSTGSSELLETKDFEWSGNKYPDDPLTDSEQITGTDDGPIYTMQVGNDRIEHSTIQESEDYHFLMSILPEMKKLPPLQKMRLRTKINAALMEEMEINYRIK